MSTEDLELASISDEHRLELHQAKLLLENPSVAARVSDALGTPLEKGLKLLPASVRESIIAVTTKSLTAALDTAIYTMSSGRQPATSRLHKIGAALSGAAGGAFGLPALAIELPLSTTIILRSIADIARSEGEDLTLRETQLSCLEVFALGGSSSGDDAAESGYFGVRAGLAKAVSDAAKYLASHGVASKGAPALARLVSQIAVRFSIPVSQKAAAQAVPLVGAAGGALINTVFIDHFQDVARGHFIVRRLERSYGEALVRETYKLLPNTPDLNP